MRKALKGKRMLERFSERFRDRLKTKWTKSSLELQWTFLGSVAPYNHLTLMTT